MSRNYMQRPDSSSAEEWALFLEEVGVSSEHIGFLAVAIAESIEAPLNKIRQTLERTDISGDRARHLARCFFYDDLKMTGRLPQEPEYAWVIEHEDSTAGTPQYFTGMRHSALEWSDSHLRACRFARKEDAERIRDYIAPYKNSHRVIEHGWS